MQQKQNKSSLLPLWMMLVSTLVPFLAALYIHLNYDKLNIVTKQYGEFIDAPFEVSFDRLQDLQGEEIASTSFKKHWRLIYIQPQTCDEACIERQHYVNNLKKSLGKYQSNLALIGVRSNEFHPTVSIDKQFQPDHLLLMDPQDKVILSYQPQADLKKVRKDLMKLVKHMNG